MDDESFSHLKSSSESQTRQSSSKFIYKQQVSQNKKKNCVCVSLSCSLSVKKGLNKFIFTWKRVKVFPGRAGAHNRSTCLTFATRRLLANQVVRIMSSLSTSTITSCSSNDQRWTLTLTSRSSRRPVILIVILICVLFLGKRQFDSLQVN